ncbi:hypothetical protein GA0061100_102243 [Rhizobium hainanense]|uniref:Uncharacterized protein n=1 Tax=Rhizobium hainanense TaxID=52131 RepID=A0A1C3UH92_9HYPH|nr:hypothetical protein GA0061100_102243 [Rhizobium hainanense]
MWPIFKSILSRSKLFNSIAGDVVFATAGESGSFRHSLFEWRVKELLNKSDVVIGVKMKPDSYAGVEGDVTNYINFDIETAIRLRDHLNECIDFAQNYRTVCEAASYSPISSSGTIL